MFPMLITITVLATLYGLAWHNQPAREPVSRGGALRKQDSHE